MFDSIDLNLDIDSIVRGIDHNNKTAKDLRKKIDDLKYYPDSELNGEISCSSLQDSVSKTTSKSSSFHHIILQYHSISADLESIIHLLPKPSDYSYRDVIMRLYAESLKDIKEMTEMRLLGEVSEEEAKDFIENENSKIDILNALLNPEKEDYTSSNKIVLSPSLTGKIRALEDLDSIPNDYYSEFADLIQSIVTGRFKRFKRLKRFKKSTNSSYAIGTGVCEVRGTQGRVLFQRLNQDTYTIIAIFLKKSDNDKAYQEFLKNRLSESDEVVESMKKYLDKPEFIEMNDFYVAELWNKLGVSDDKCKEKIV